MRFTAFESRTQVRSAILMTTGTGVQYNEATGKWYHTGKRAVLQYGFHSLRHSTVSLLQEAGTPQAVVQALVGHRSSAMTQRYTHVDNEALQSAVNGIKAIKNGKDSDNSSENEQSIREEAAQLVKSAPIAEVKTFVERLKATSDGSKDES